jgi:D-amino-acid oxidase
MADNSKRVNNVLVIGAGVSGLTTALVLARETEPIEMDTRFHVKILAENEAKDTVSSIAGALWEFPPAVCGHHGNQISITRSKQWCMESYKQFNEIFKGYNEKDTGVTMRRANFYFDSINEHRIERLKKEQLVNLAKSNQIFEFGNLTNDEITAVPREFGINEGYRFSAPTIDTPIYTKWLRAQLKGLANVDFITMFDSRESNVSRITDRLIPQAAALRKRYEVDAIVNCTGMGAAELAGACMVPLRGALVKVPKTSWSDQSKVPAAAHAIAKSRNKQDMVFVVPRVNHVMFGGIAEPGQYDIHIGKNYPPIQKMFARCKKFLPDVLKGIELDDAKIEIDVGIRPYRVENVCLEREYGFNIVHNYGHGGSGFTLSWGCAKDVVDLLESMEDASFHAARYMTTPGTDTRSIAPTSNGDSDMPVNFTIEEEPIYS